MDKLYKLGDNALFALVLFLVLSGGLFTGSHTQTVSKDAEYHSEEFVDNVNRIIKYNPDIPKIYTSINQAKNTVCRLSIVRTHMIDSVGIINITSLGFTTIYAIVPQGSYCIKGFTRNMVKLNSPLPSLNSSITLLIFGN